MTRFARAKGSKSSNERIPNEGTPWHVMKHQLEEALQREGVPQEKTKTARELLKEKDDVYYPQTLGNVSGDWAEFENNKNKTNNSVKSGKVEKKPKDQQKKLKAAADKSISEQNGLNESTSANNETDKVGKGKGFDNKKQKNKNVAISENKNVATSENNTENNPAKEQNNVDEKKVEKQNINSEPNQFKNKKRKKKANDVAKPTSEDTTNSEQAANNDKPENSGTKLSKRQKRNKKKQDQISEPQSERSNTATFNVEGNDWDNSVDTGKRRKVDNNQNGKVSGNEHPNNRGDKWSQFEFKNFRRFGENVPKKFQRKVAKPRDEGNHQRRKPDNNVMKVTINGMDVEIVKYDGYPVKREDAERLKELRQKMVLKGIPKSEIDAAMKLERRKCEKTLARIRKQVCFHCRKAGHNLSDCPELGKEEAGTGICFKCGSTEHTHFECKVTKSDDYRYAKCFICREQGHISKQCPDNPKGMYPDGGCCKICGDVTHLKKDCPDLTKEKEETTITLDTIKDSNLESLDGDFTPKPQEKAPAKKIVKF